MIAKPRVGAVGRDGGTVEVIGFILTFAISAVVLTISTQAFRGAQDQTDALVTGVELRGIADRVASRVLQAGSLAQEFPNATLSVRVRAPVSAAGHPFAVEGERDRVWANATDDSFTANSTTYKLEVVPLLDVTGRVPSGRNWLRVEYEATRRMDSTGNFAESAGWFYRNITLATEEE